MEIEERRKRFLPPPDGNNTVTPCYENLREHGDTYGKGRLSCLLEHPFQYFGAPAHFNGFGGHEVEHVVQDIQDDFSGSVGRKTTHDLTCLAPGMETIECDGPESIEDSSSESESDDGSIGRPHAHRRFSIPTKKRKRPQAVATSASQASEPKPKPKPKPKRAKTKKPPPEPALEGIWTSARREQKHRRMEGFNLAKKQEAARRRSRQDAKAQIKMDSYVTDLT
ncbi:unnamed protein product [Chrysoparadoxa australica]